ncbi:MAG: hypothetical protein KME42_10860 [Tildeniella nuda ZEHNDER 1965/U140]|nr:hypothetical protein [Tildeniella nuda ZEHNDER 1965/U140]
MTSSKQCGRTERSRQRFGGSGLRSLTMHRYHSINQSGLSGSWAIGSWAIGSWAIVSLTVVAPSQAQQLVPLPPPPTVSVPGLMTTPSATNSTPLPGGETVFLAPINRSGAAGQYTVYVSGDSPYLLQQVRSIEPSASVQRYQGQPAIQVGTFDNEAGARRQVAALNSQGIMAEVATTNAATIAAPSNVATTSRYVVVIPGGRDELSSLADRAIRMGIRQEAIQEKGAPLGPHLEIGPFVQHNDAKKISQFLNGGGLDARVHYNR